ncbi:MAG TPA: exodeoxyribonuclease VII large subunit, partial [Xanthomonadales bacterium]|nr:exodeoxyribonuclease VII large subunit [Xanthomonadales bacterium]
HRLQQYSQRLDHLAHRLAQQHPELKLRAQRRELATASELLQRAMQRSVKSRQNQLQTLQYRLQLRHPRRLLQQQSQALGTTRQRLRELMRARMQQARGELQQLARTLNAVSPLATLDRGYAVLGLAEKEQVISRIGQVQAGDKVNAQLADGRLYCSIDRISLETLPGLAGEELDRDV